MQSNQEFSKLEKADILELVVRQLKSPMPVQTTPPPNHPPAAIFTFESGVQLCADETISYLQQFTNADTDNGSPHAFSQQRALVERVHSLKQSIKYEPSDTVLLPSSNNCPIAAAPSISPDAGVLLDLSCNSRRNQLYSTVRTASAPINTNHFNNSRPPMDWSASVAPPPSPTDTQHKGAKREVLWKIRRKILAKRQAQQCRGQMGRNHLGVDDGFMWRPW